MLSYLGKICLKLSRKLLAYQYLVSLWKSYCGICLLHSSMKSVDNSLAFNSSSLKESLAKELLADNAIIK